MAYPLTGHVVFADDIRQEVGGRFTLVGVVFGGVEVPSFPAVLAKLGISATTYQPATNLKPLRLLIEIVPVDGEAAVIAAHEIDPSQYPPPDPRYPPPSDGIRKAITQMNLVLSPLALQGPSRIRVSAICVDETTVLGEVDFISPAASP